MKRWMPALGIAMVLSLSFGAPHASGQQQRPGSERSGMTREQMEQRVFRDFESRIARELGLDVSRQAEFARILADFRNQRAPLLHQRMRTQARMRRHLSAGGSEEEGRAILASLRGLREREMVLQHEEEDRLMEILTPSQLLQLLHMREQFVQRIRRLESGGSPGGRPPGPGPRR